MAAVRKIFIILLIFCNKIVCMPLRHQIEDDNNITVKTIEIFKNEHKTVYETVVPLKGFLVTFPPNVSQQNVPFALANMNVINTAIHRIKANEQGKQVDKQEEKKKEVERNANNIRKDMEEELKRVNQQLQIIETLDEGRTKAIMEINNLFDLFFWDEYVQTHHFNTANKTASYIENQLIDCYDNNSVRLKHTVFDDFEI
uniref:Uncharacterized protein n=1 Tax=Panagrolaimus superbus TaxID=310955 RepID=A0A914YKH2_9BILA